MRMVIIDGGRVAWKGPDTHTVSSAVEFLCYAFTETVDKGGVRVEFHDATDSPLLALAPPDIDPKAPLLLAKGYRKDGSWFLAAVGTGITMEDIKTWGPAGGKHGRDTAREMTRVMQEEMEHDDFIKALQSHIKVVTKTLAAMEKLYDLNGQEDAVVFSYHTKTPSLFPENLPPLDEDKPTVH